MLNNSQKKLPSFILKPIAKSTLSRIILILLAAAVFASAYFAEGYYKGNKYAKEGDNFVNEGQYPLALKAYFKSTAWRKNKDIEVKKTKARLLIQSEGWYKRGERNVINLEWEKCIDSFSKVAADFPNYNSAQIKIDDCKAKIEAKIKADEEAFAKAEAEKATTKKTEPISISSATAPNIGSKYIDIDLYTHKLKLYDGANVLLSAPIVSGQPGTEKVTPTGDYKILNKSVRTYSTAYNMWMPFWQAFFGGYGIHSYDEMKTDADIMFPYGTGGCIALSQESAKKLYDLTSIGMPIHIRNSDPNPACTASFEKAYSEWTAGKISNEEMNLVAKCRNN